MTPTLRAALAALVLAGGSAVAAAPAAAQQVQTGFADFGSDQQTPIEIEADELEVQDKASEATFAGNVTVRQGETALQTSRLKVLYAQSALATRTRAEGGTTPEGQSPATPTNQRISRLEASGKVLITAKGQSATGDTGVVNFDARTLALNGNVTLAQGQNVVTGDTLTVDLNTGVARVQSKGRVRVLLTPGGAQSN
jgi:lipopolysaccharide export system protein LptA